MLSQDYSYQDCLDKSLQVTWKEDDVLGGKDFDYSKRFLPNRLCGVDGIQCLNEDEKRKLNQAVPEMSDDWLETHGLSTFETLNTPRW